MIRFDLDLFESAVKVIHPASDAAALETLCIRWLPLKLDDDARTHTRIKRSVSKFDLDGTEESKEKEYFFRLFLT